MKQEPKAETMLLRKKLNSHPAFADVNHAHFHLTEDQEDKREWQADVLEFSYRDRPYFVHIDQGGKLIVSRPGGHNQLRQVGRALPADAQDLAFQIAAMIDAAGHE